MGSGERADRVTRLLVVTLAALSLCAAESVRPAAVAGDFYPADATMLAQAIDGMLAKAQAKPASGVVAIVAPHAGYAYSGSVAAEAYAALRGRKFTRVVVIAPTHVEAFDFTSVYQRRRLSDPAWPGPSRSRVRSKLAKMDPSLRLSTTGHLRPPCGASIRWKSSCPSCSACWVTSNWCRS